MPWFANPELPRFLLLQTVRIHCRQIELPDVARLNTACKSFVPQL